MSKARSRSTLLACALAISCVVHAAVPSAAAETDEEPLDCRPRLVVVKASRTWAPRALAPEPITHARVVNSPALDVDVARHAQVRAGETIRQRHVAVVLKHTSSLKAVSPLHFDGAIWTDMIVLMSGASPGTVQGLDKQVVLRTLLESGLFVTLRARLPAQNAAPVGAISLGKFHYAIDLRSLVAPPRSRNQTQLSDLRTYGTHRPKFGRQNAAQFSSPIPGGLTKRGVFRGRLVGFRNESGEIEPILSSVNAVITTISGTWHYENEWLTLRIPVSEFRLNSLSPPD